MTSINIDVLAAAVAADEARDRIAKITAENGGRFPVAACPRCGCWTSFGGMSHRQPQCPPGC